MTESGMLCTLEECVELQIPLERIFEKPDGDRQLVLWSTAIHLLNLVYNVNWEDGRNVKNELAGARSRLEKMLEEIENWWEEI
jgi:hypothetical protein